MKPKAKKASLGLSGLASAHKEDQSSMISKAKPKETKVSSQQHSNKVPEKKSKQKKKQVIPFYIEPALHEALHTLVFTERHKKTTFQTLLTEGLDLALKERGLPSVSQLSSGEKVLNP